MRFSVIVPAHNVEDYLERGLRSIKDQTFTDYELIVVCDSCTDGTAEIARRYADRVEIVDYSRPGYARNVGMAASTGEYLLFMDADDWWLHEYVFQQLHDKLVAEKNPDLLCYSFIFKGRGVATPRGNFGNYFPAVWNKCWKKSFLRGIFFNEKMIGEDFDFLCQALKRNPGTVEWDMPMYYYNHGRENSITKEIM